MTGKAERESLWFQYGTDRQYQAWVRNQHSALSGATQNIVYAHYRTSKNSGTGFKPPFSGIPLTYAEHLRQHQIGQFNFMPREWWEEKCQYYLNKWKESKAL
ncbi:hypothetical protein UFOVP191_15 [uncultured Caudovirales phage]|uniref:Uncharacterized protein n=1 Tax=uncultured Caudovirales phage TaxID=2100421 RepID=A0A6J7WKP6_9CAUD|nr:hypothetical protein UFOVP191_15 [uncultured Caudovirales phage]